MSKNKKLKRNATSAIAEVAFCPSLLHGIFNFSLKIFRAIEKKSKAIKTKKKNSIQLLYARSFPDVLDLWYI